MERLLRFNPEPFVSELEFESFEHDFENEAEMEEEFRRRGGMGRPMRFGRMAKRPLGYRMTPRTPFRKSLSRQPLRTAQGRFSGQAPFRAFGGNFRPYAMTGGQQGHPWTKRYGMPNFGRGHRGWRNPWGGANFDPVTGDDGGMPSDFVSWIQASLNNRLGLRLPVDGSMSPATRNAVRSFQ